MPEVVEAHSAYKQADKDALLLRFRARATLGLAIDRERKRGATWPQIGEALGVSDEQARRYASAYKEWLREYPKEPLG